MSAWSRIRPSRISILPRQVMPIEHKLARQQHRPLILFLTRTRIIRDSSRLQLHTMATIITHRQRTRGRGRPRLQPIAQGAMEPQRSLRTAIETYLQPRQHNQHLRMPTHKQIGRLGIMLLVSFFYWLSRWQVVMVFFISIEKFNTDHHFNPFHSSSNSFQASRLPTMYCS